MKRIVTRPQKSDMGSGFGYIDAVDCTLEELLDFYAKNKTWGTVCIHKNGEILRKFDYDTFNVAYELYDETPSDLSYAVAARVLSGDRDYDVMAFRTDYYHPFGNPYTNVDNVYFSTY